MTPRKVNPRKQPPNGTPRAEVAVSATPPAPGTPAPVPLILDGSLPPDPPGMRRTRGELRLSMQHVMDTNIRRRLEAAAADPTTPLKDVLAIAELYARVGVGFIGTNEVDPADVAKLPPPVIQVLDPTAELPDGKPDPV